MKEVKIRIIAWIIILACCLTFWWLVTKMLEQG